MTNEFPVLFFQEYNRNYENCPKTIPYKLLKAYNQQIIKTYNKNIYQLASEGGLDPIEIVAILNNLPYPYLKITVGTEILLAEAIKELNERLSKYDDNVN